MGGRSRKKPSSESLEIEDYLPRKKGRFWFPHHTQEHPMCCAPASVRMLAEWLTGKLYTENAVAKAIGWKGSYRGTLAHRRRLVSFLEGLGGKASWAWWWKSELPHDPERDEELRDQLMMTKADPVVAMCLVSLYRCTSRLSYTNLAPVNVGHWILVRSVRTVSTEMDAEQRSSAPGDRRTHVAVVHDPAFTEPYFETWDSLSGRVIDSALVVRRRRLSSRDARDDARTPRRHS